ncbi:MAG: hypothetical protein WA687_06625, partial [Solirubrobacterales bacterium]
APTRRLEPAAATRKLNPHEGKARASGHRRGLLAAAGAAILAGIAIAAVIALGNGDDGGSDPGTTTIATDAAAAKAAAKDTGPKPLTESQLIAKADAICESSQRRYLEVRDLESEHATDVPYAEALVRIARPRVHGLRALTPPPPIANAYEEYVEAQERVYVTDKQALAAAKEEDAAGVEAARAKRDSEDALRERLAREIGFTVCSTPQT